MNTPEEYDARIARIMSKIDAIKDREFRITCGEWPPAWEPPVTEEAVAALEKKYNFRLPEDYRRFITTVAASGSQPFYGLENLFDKDKDDEFNFSSLGKPFPYTIDKPLIMIHLTEEELYGDDEEEDDNEEEDEEGGYIPLCTEGCGMYSMLVVNSDDPDTYGTVWFWDFSDDYGTAPIGDKASGKPFHFLDWLEYWVDRTAQLSPEEYFTYMETVLEPEPPDNPDIIGRKMGWIK